MLVAPASRLFSTSSFTAVPRFSTTCPEQMRCTDRRSMGRMAPAGCGLGTGGQQTTSSGESGQKAQPSEPGGEAGTRESRNRAGGRGTARARSAAPVRGAKRPGQGVRARGAGPVPGRCTHSPGLSRLHRGPDGAGRAALSSGSRPARSAPGAAGARPPHTDGAPGPAAQPRPPPCGDAPRDSTPANGRRAGGLSCSLLGATHVTHTPLRQWARRWAGRQRRSGRAAGREPPCPRCTRCGRCTARRCWRSTCPAVCTPCPTCTAPPAPPRRRRYERGVGGRTSLGCGPRCSLWRGQACGRWAGVPSGESPSSGRDREEPPVPESSRYRVPPPQPPGGALAPPRRKRRDRGLNKINVFKNFSVMFLKASAVLILTFLGSRVCPCAGFCV